MDIPIADLQKHLDGIAKTFEQPLPDALSKCADEIRGAFAGNFAFSSYSGGGWPPRKDAKTHPLLILSGRLKQAATQEGAAGNVSENSGRELGVGVEKSAALPYVFVHQKGYKAIPARPYIDVSEQVVDRCEAIVTEELAKKLQT